MLMCKNFPVSNPVHGVFIYGGTNRMFIKVAGYRFNEIHDFTNGYFFLAKSICADGVAVCALFVYR